ncbi:MAG: hypothetical protein HYY80_03500 [Chloroflexi bacterium]|nr:hypothetical protein [Chloroflexota bacterium]
MQIRRQYLEPDPVGKQLVALYDAVGPILASYLDTHSYWKQPMRAALRPIIWLCRYALKNR